jgi:Ser/Thr protein kinase RdoA (MazF antagonist)
MRRKHFPGMSHEPERLEGGNVNQVERRGDRVHRTAGPWTSTIHALLRHARVNGVAWIPEPFGLDDKGREILEFLPGEVPHAMPAWVWMESVLEAIGKALRQWHDAAASFPRDGAVWNFPAVEPVETICHNDFAPYNCVFRDGRFSGAIDFDFCAPGPRVRDLAWAAYRFVPLQPTPEEDVEDGGNERSPFPVSSMGRRLALFLDAYAQGDEALRPALPDFLLAVAERLEEVARWTSAHAAENPDSPLVGHARMYRAHALWLRSGGMASLQS